MIKRLLFLIITVIIVTLLVFWFQDHPGFLVIRWLGYEVEAQVSVALLVLSLGFFCVWGVLGLLKKILHFPQFLKGRYGAHHQRRGLQSLYNALSSLEAEDVKKLLIEGEGISSHWSEKPLETFFKANAAYYSNDFKGATEAFNQLRLYKETEFLGFKGLIKLALKQDQEEKALELAIEADKIYPQSPYIAKFIYQHSLMREKFDQALMMMPTLLRLKIISEDEAESQRAFIYVSEANKFKEEGKSDEADNLYEKALQLRPDLLPVALANASRLIEAGKARKVRNLIEKIWPQTPHPDLVPYYLRTFNDTHPMEQFKQVQRLVSFAPDHPQSFLESGRYALNAKVWGRARSFLMELVERENATAEVYKLLATLELEEHHDKNRSEQWLQKATMAPQASMWRCESCLKPQDAWLGSCPDCWAWGRINWIGVSN